MRYETALPTLLWIAEAMRRKDQPAPPCAHMKKMLHDAADGHSRGLRLWFTLQHVVHCGPCRRYLECLKEMISALRGKSEGRLQTDVEARLTERIDEASSLIRSHQET